MIKKVFMGIFRNILPATFTNAFTYAQQIKILKDKLNEVIEYLNSLEVVEKEEGDDSNVE